MSVYHDILGDTPRGFEGGALLKDRAALLDGWAEIYRLPQAPVAIGTARAAWYAKLIPALDKGKPVDGATTFMSTVDGELGGLGDLMAYAFASVGLGEPIPHRADAAGQQALAAAVGLLEEVLPRVAEQVLPFVSVGVVVENPIPSMYLSQTPEVIYVGHRMLERQTWELADAILHESLHDTSELARQVRHLFVPAYSEENSATTLLPWSVKQPTKRYFTTWRLLSACHVYVHLAGFRRAVDGPSAEEIQVPAERARFMLDHLLAPPHFDSLGEDGRVFVKWMDRSLEAMREVRV